MDVFGDYKYLFFMCGGVIVVGGLFLFILNMYNYHMLDKESLEKDRKQNQISLENRDEVNSSEEQRELNEPEVIEMNTARQEPELEHVQETN